jgi:hypothetical protein
LENDIKAYRLVPKYQTETEKEESEKRNTQNKLDTTSVETVVNPDFGTMTKMEHEPNTQPMTQKPTQPSTDPAKQCWICEAPEPSAAPGFAEQTCWRGDQETDPWNGQFNVYNGYCVFAPSHFGAGVELRECNWDDPLQWWNFNKKGDGWQIKLMNGNCLGTKDGVPTLMECNTGDKYQYWEYEPKAGSSVAQVKSVHGGKAFTCPSTKSWTTNIKQEDCPSSCKFTRVGPPGYPGACEGTYSAGTCLEPVGGERDQRVSGTKLEMKECQKSLPPSGLSPQAWRFSGYGKRKSCSAINGGIYRKELVDKDCRCNLLKDKGAEHKEVWKKEKQEIKDDLKAHPNWEHGTPGKSGSVEELKASEEKTSGDEEKQYNTQFLMGFQKNDDA